MEIKRVQTTPINFQGYDARPLKGIVLRYVQGDKLFAETAQELHDAASKNKLDVFVQTSDSVHKRDFKNILRDTALPPNPFVFWTQDNPTFTNNGKVLGNKFLERINEKISNFAGRRYEELQHHLQGGNFFIFKDKNTDKLLLGRDELDFYHPETLKKDLNVSEICTLSQPDFHLDLAIRPLKNKVVLVADDETMLEQMAQGINKIKLYLSKNHDPQIRLIQHQMEELYQMHKACVKDFTYTPAQKIYEELQQKGFTPVKTPSRIFRPSLTSDNNDDSHFLLNYMNSVVHEKPDGSLLYLTNKSMLDDILGITPEIEKKIDFSFEKIFKDSVKDYIKPEDIRFISGGGFVPKCLSTGPGGVHCLTAEIPKI